MLLILDHAEIEVRAVRVVPEDAVVRAGPRRNQKWNRNVDCFRRVRVIRIVRVPECRLRAAFVERTGLLPAAEEPLVRPQRTNTAALRAFPAHPPSRLI